MDKNTLRDIVEWDIGNWSRAIDFWESAAKRITAPNAEGLLALDIGGRNGGLSLYWALRGCRVICSDINDAGFPKARALHQKYHVGGRIQYQAVNALDIPYRNELDIVTFKSVLGRVGSYEAGFERAEEMMRQIYAALKPGGYLFFAENLAGTPLHMFLRKRFRPNYAKSWHYVTVEEIRGLTEPFQDFAYHTYGVFATLSDGKRLKPVLEAADLTFDRFFPENARYIISAVCRKPE